MTLAIFESIYEHFNYDVLLLIKKLNVQKKKLNVVVKVNITNIFDIEKSNASPNDSSMLKAFKIVIYFPMHIY